MKTVLIDDEELALRYLEYQLMLIGGFDIIGKYTDPLEGKRAVEELDVVFLDIHIPELNGIELAEILLERKPGLNVVFITTYEEYAVKAFDLNALDYVLKPIRLERLKLAARKIQQRKAAPVSPVSFSRLWRIRLFGEFMLMGDGERKMLHFRTSKAQELFFYLLHNHGKAVEKAFLMEMLWPEFEWSKASSQLYTTVYHIRKTLEPLRERFLLQNDASGYVLKLNGIEIDADEFEQFLKSNLPLSDDAAKVYEQKLKLLEGEYLEGFQFDWAEYERQRYQIHWIRLKLKLANWYYEQQEFEKAFQICEHLCKRFPLEEQAQLMYLKICDKLGDHFLVQKQYQLYQSLLDREDHDAPGAEISHWYKSREEKQRRE